MVGFWSPFEIASHCFCVDFFSANLRNYGKIRCLDCTDIREQERCFPILKQVDLVVVGLPQIPEKLDVYFSRDNGMLRSFDNVMYLLTNYVAYSAPDLPEIRQRYRIDPMRLGVVPYNARLDEAARRENLNGYFEKSQSCLEAYELYIGFWSALNRCVLQMVNCIQI